MPRAIYEGTRVHFVEIDPSDNPEHLAYFLRHMANSLGEEPILEVSAEGVTIDCGSAPRTLQFLEGCRDGRLLPVREGDTVYFRERGPMN